MLRQLPPTLTADQTPDWLPVGWIAHSTVLKRGRQTRTYTHLRTGKKLYTKDQVLEYIIMDKIREKRQSGIERKKANLKALQDQEIARERPSWPPDNWKADLRTGSYVGNPYTIHENMSTSFKPHSKEEVPHYQKNTMESEASSEETGINYITYDTDEEDYSENEYNEDRCSRENVENLSNMTTSTPLRLLPERLQKLESRAITQCLLEDEDMSSDNEEKHLDVETSKEENAFEETQVVSHLVESFEEESLHDVVVESVEKTREIPGWTGSFSIEINLECEDSFLEKDWNESRTEKIGTRNIEIRDQQSDLMHVSASSKVVEVTQESGDKTEEPLKAQATQEETADDSRTSVFFPYREAPSHSVLVFDNSNARSSADDLNNGIELGLNPCADIPQEKNTSGSKKRKKSPKPCSSKNVKKKDSKAQTDKGRKGKRTQGEKGSWSVKMEKKLVDWPEPCPNFPFEPITSSFPIEDDSVIRRYIEQHFTAAGSPDSNLPLPDFGLPSFSNIKISLNEEPESKKKKSPDPPCVQVASSSLPSCRSMSATMQQPVAGN
ncbi:hypothetical protein EUTSA_v10023394mg [Eutrema salsugineum]|uniref:MBD domain-containing protein n=1 Tax=Eutrema salsugineum TaxID=72664 RepID=V4JUM1_EUTSA|nr:uncharacterized protein LOC18010237 [Eutrema salsugineum]ESQ29050.1 hypothetical protein EUTSA_v10023394mg [Eutrema salsugineum]